MIITLWGNFFAEMVLPPNANVYYAVNTAYNLNFILRPKRPDDTDSSGKNSKGKTKT